MDVTPLIPAGRQVIQGYSAGAFRISGETHQGAVIVFPGETLAWTPDDLAALAARARESDVVLYGSGAGPVANAPALRDKLQAQGLHNVEIMTTAAACRTYNVLMAEGRRVAAALLPV